ncbi:hypothetical protein [Streptantibioticus silvisoli]|uniref:Uncharacterized protein n=1 Tax=Streptantibioticus silvisoli TaxID=2705255 RepID=A0ABT6W4R2_9ACTN|nr:hypothetical protein [Streptantibioticus silvisoli]MDI5965743.1 hypothetical protein [Streptantibioticus silvisoli]
MTTEPELWNSERCAEEWGLTGPDPGRVWRSYVSKGYAPQADAYDGRSPRWKASKVIAASAARTGQGRPRGKTLAERLDAALTFTETLGVAEEEFEVALDLTTPAEDRREDAGSVEMTLSAMSAALDEVRAFCARRADEYGATLPGLRSSDPQHPSLEAIRADAFRILFRDFARDCSRISLNAAATAQLARAAVHPD